MTVCVRFIGTVILNKNRHEILHLACLDEYHPLFFGQLFACFNGIVYPITKKCADVKRLYKIYLTKIISCRKINTLFTGFFCLVLNQNIKEIVARMNII